MTGVRQTQRGGVSSAKAPLRREGDDRRGYRPRSRGDMTVVRGVAVMQAWADYLDELRDAGKVIPLRRENR